MKSKKCSRRQKFLHLLKKLRYYIFATLVLLVAGIVFFFFLRRVLLESYQHTETNLAQSYALEVEGGLNTYETLISYGTHMIDARDQEGDTEEELRNRIQQYCLRIQTVLDDQVDPYVVYDGKIIAANPWEGDDSYDYTSAVWYQKAMEADGQVVFTDVYNRCHLQPHGGDGGPEVRRQRRGGGHGHLPRKPGHPARGHQPLGGHLHLHL